MALADPGAVATLLAMKARSGCRLLLAGPAKFRLAG